MYNVCIADDEILIQKSIAARLRASGTPVRVAGCADSAKNAVSLYWDSRPDIFFVDINMPGMDGLSLIRQIREEDPSCATKFIIITGYDDFAHMREAIQSGVTDYLKKPIATGEFNQVVAQAVKLIEKEKRGTQYKREGLLFYDEYLSDPPRIIDGGTFMAVYGPDADAFAAAEKKMFELWAAPPPPPHPCTNSGGCLCLVFRGIGNVKLYYAPEQKVSQDAVRRSLSETAKNKKMFFVYTRPESERLDALAERSEQTMNKRFLSSGAAECIPKSLVSTTDTGILDYALERGQADACRQALKACLNELAGKDSFYQELSPFYRQVVLLLINKYMAHQMPIPDSLKQEFSLFALCRYPNLESLGAHLNGMVLSLAQKIGGQTRSGELVQEVCEYLKIKYSEEIALNDVAAHFYVSPPYLSRRFREKTGLTFVEYLEDIRMDRAREYLLNSSAQIADISEQVGYLDPAYFAKIFKKKYNLSPSEYRMKNKS